MFRSGVSKPTISTRIQACSCETWLRDLPSRERQLQPAAAHRASRGVSYP